MTVNMVPSNTVPVNGQIIINLPFSWANSNNNSIDVLTSTSPTCTLISANLNSSWTCTATPSNQITISNATSSSSVGPFSFTIGGVLSTPLSYFSSEVTVSTQTSSGKVIDGNTVCQTSAPNPRTATITLNSATQTVSTSFSLNLSIVLPVPIATSDTVTISVPFAFSVVSSNNVYAQVNGCGSLLGFFLSGPSSSTGSNSVSLLYTHLSVQLTCASFVSINETLSNIVLIAPPSTAPSTLTITYMRNGSPFCTGTVAVTANTNTLTSVSVSSTIKTINQGTVFTINLTTASVLSAGSSIVVNISS